MVDEETGRVVEKEGKGRGYELANGKYVEIEEEELEAVEVESTHTIDIDKIVPEADIDKRYYERPYYIGPRPKAGRRPSPSSATRCATRVGLRWHASCSPTASIF
jgi:non-homologous end joining protein Ku